MHFSPDIGGVAKNMDISSDQNKSRTAESLFANTKNCYLLGPRTNPTQHRNLMNTDREMENEEVLRVKLEVMRRQHRDLDEAIQALQESARSDPLSLRRLKKQKLGLKDQIARIEDILTPDIIA